MRCDGGVVRFGHAGDQPHLGDAAGVAQVGLQDRGSAFLQHLAEAPLGEDSLAGGNGQMRSSGDFRHHVVVLRLAGFLRHLPGRTFFRTQSLPLQPWARLTRDG